MATIFSNLNTSIKSLITNMTGSGRDTLTTAQFLSHIEDKHPAIRYSKTQIDELAAACAVCLSEFKEGESVRNLECKHLFHNSCLDKWLQQCKATCPLCRNQVVAEEVVDSYRRENERGSEEISHEEMVLLTSSLRGNNNYLGFW